MRFKNVFLEAGEPDRMKKFSPDKIQEMMKKLEQGSIDIEFMQDRKTGRITLVTKFNGQGVNYFFNKDKAKIKYFSSTSSLKDHMDKSLMSNYNSDFKAVRREIFDAKSMENVFTAINSIIQEYPNKAKSLTFSNKHARRGEENSSWDAQVIFKRSMEEFARNGEYRIIPKVNAKGRHANITGPEEIEKPMKNKDLKKFLSSL